MAKQKEKVCGADIHKKFIVAAILSREIHQALESSCIKISSVLSDIFGKSGMQILNGLLEGKSIDDILYIAS